MTAHFYFFFFNDTATTEIYTLSLHDALPISPVLSAKHSKGTSRIRIMERYRFDKGVFFLNCIFWPVFNTPPPFPPTTTGRDRKSTRLNSSHANISYAVFCLKKKKKNIKTTLTDVNPIVMSMMPAVSPDDVFWMSWVRINISDS